MLPIRLRVGTAKSYTDYHINEDYNIIYFAVYTLNKEQIFVYVSVNFDHFEILRAIGKGSFGKVSIRNLLYVILANEYIFQYNTLAIVYWTHFQKIYYDFRHIALLLIVCIIVPQKKYSSTIIDIWYLFLPEKIICAYNYY